MRLTAAQCLRACLCLAQAHAQEALLYLSGTSEAAAVDSTSIPNLSPAAARIVLASRLGVSQYHSIATLSEEDIAEINAVDSTSSILFQDEIHRDRRKAFVVVEGVEASNKNPNHRHFNTIKIRDPPSSEDSQKLGLDLLAQCGSVAAARRDSYHGSRNSNHLESHRSLASLQELGFDDVATRGHLIYASRQSLSDPQSHPTSAPLPDSIEQLVRWSESHDIDLILMVMPLSPKGSKGKRSSPSWGSYVKAVRANEESKQLSEAPIASRPTVNDDNSSTESAKESSTTSTSTSSPSSSASKSSTSSGEYTGPTTPPRGILPSCFSTLRSCRDATHNCSGHGSCDLQYSYKEKDDHMVSCYACTCKNDVKTNNDGGVKTTVWTGPACQKQDLTVPFWLLAGFTIALVSIVYWAIGLLYSMGSEDLPSVIGAGVAGPRAK